MSTTTGLRAVLDTNVYLSIFVFPESRIFDLWRLAGAGLLLFAIQNKSIRIPRR